MAERNLCHYFLVRFAPDPLRHEAITVGVALFDDVGGYADIRLVRGDARLGCLFPGAELPDLETLENDLRALVQGEGRAAFLASAHETFSHALQITAPNAVLTADPAAELELLYRQWAAPPTRVLGAPRRLPGARRLLLRDITAAFDEERVLSHLQRDVTAAALGGEGDPFAFDFHYRPNGVHHLLQAVVLAGEPAAVKELGFTVTRLRSRLVAHGSGLEVTGIARDPATGDALHRELLTEVGIALVGMAEVPALAARVRHDLRLA